MPVTKFHTMADRSLICTRVLTDSRDGILNVCTGYVKLDMGGSDLLIADGDLGPVLSDPAAPSAKTELVHA